MVKLLSALNKLDTRTHIEKSIDIIQQYQPEGEYHLGFSGGIDSQVLYHLAEDAGAKFTAYYQKDIAPPEVKQFIRSNYPQVIWQSEPGFNFYKKMSTKGFPLRQARWCCEYMKERGGNGQTVLLGIRAQESNSRSKYPIAGQWDKGDIHKFVVRPLLHWTRNQERKYLRDKGIEWCDLYNKGFQRLGCILCPMASPEEKRLQSSYWPKIALAWEHSFERLYNNRVSSGNDSVKRWNSAHEMFNWYINETEKIPDEQLRMIFEGAKW